MGPEKSLFDDLPAPQLGLVLTGGGSRAAYQSGALKALAPYIEAKFGHISVIVGTSIGAVNGLVTAACIKKGIVSAADEIERLWHERNFRNTFSGSPSKAFLRSIKIAMLRYTSPGPVATTASIFDPTPLMNRIDSVLEEYGGLTLETRDPRLNAVGVMATIEGTERRPLLIMSSRNPIEAAMMRGASFDVAYVDRLEAKHGLASAALPSVLPPVELDVDRGKVRLVDGGISDNFPIDPAVRMGAERVVLLDVSGREWWLNHYGQPSYTRPTWELLARDETFCVRPSDFFVVRSKEPLGMLLKQAVAGSRKEFISALGPTWPIFTILKKKMGENLAYEVASYVALHPDYIAALIEKGYNDALAAVQSGGLFADGGE